MPTPLWIMHVFLSFHCLYLLLLFFKDSTISIDHPKEFAIIPTGTPKSKKTLSVQLLNHI